MSNVESMRPNIPELYVSIQPPCLWYRLGEGDLKVQFTDTRSQEWGKPELWLIYVDTHEPIRCRMNEPYYRVGPVVMSSDKTTLTYLLRIKEITKNHRARPFCLSLEVGDGGVCVTGAFVVKGRRPRSERRSHLK